MKNLKSFESLNENESIVLKANDPNKLDNIAIDVNQNFIFLIQGAQVDGSKSGQQSASEFGQQIAMDKAQASELIKHLNKFIGK
jgi:uncharacterized protein YajQ (UPF0234 family)